MHTRPPNLILYIVKNVPRFEILMLMRLKLLMVMLVVRNGASKKTQTLDILLVVWFCVPVNVLPQNIGWICTRVKLPKHIKMRQSIFMIWVGWPGIVPAGLCANCYMKDSTVSKDICNVNRRVIWQRRCLTWWISWGRCKMNLRVPRRFHRLIHIWHHTFVLIICLMRMLKIQCRHWCLIARCHVVGVPRHRLSISHLIGPVQKIWKNNVHLLVENRLILPMAIYRPKWTWLTRHS